MDWQLRLVPGLIVGMFISVSGCVNRTMDRSDHEAVEDVQHEIVRFAMESEERKLARGGTIGDKGVAEEVAVKAENPLNFEPLKILEGDGRIEHPLKVARGGEASEKNSAPVAKVIAPGDRDARFNINVESAPIREFFSSLVKDTPYNILVHPGVSGTLSINLKNVTVPEVVDVACNLYELSCTRNDVGYQISPQSVQLRQFRLFYPNIYRQGTSSTQVSSGQKNSSTSTTSNDKGSTEKKSDSSSGFGVTTGYKADFWAELTNTLCALLGLTAKDVAADADKRNLSCQTEKKEGANPGASPAALEHLPKALADVELPQLPEQPKVEREEVVKAISVSPQTGVIMIRAFPAEMRQLKILIDEMQANLLQQVVLEAKILEVALNDHFQTGINWSFVSNLKGDRKISQSMTGGGTAFDAPTTTHQSDMGNSPYVGGPYNSLTMDGAVPNYSVNSQVTTTTVNSMGGANGPASTTTNNTTNTNIASSVIPFSSFGGIFAYGLALNDFNGFLELLKGQGNVTVLSSPRIATLNNQKAMIKVGVDDRFIENIETKVTNNIPETTITFNTYFSGVALDVMPQIVSKDRLILHIHPSVTDVSDKRRMVRGEAFDLASNNMRESDSMVFSSSGEVIVIGGLMKTAKKKGRQFVPFLGDIPYLGELFGHRLEVEQKSELVILMRATITDGKQFWPDEVSSSLGRLESMEPPVRISAPVQ